MPDIHIQPLTSAIGAEIGGVNLAKPLSDNKFETIHKAFLDHHVIFFRDQKITPEDFKRFATYFGPLWRHPYIEGLKDHPEVMVIKKEPDDEYNFAGAWHTDTSYQKQPCLGSMLYALEVPDIGGDTLFANQCLAYENLSEPMQFFLRDKTAMHSYYGAANAGRELDLGTGYAPVEQEKANKVEHPVVRVHPESGKCSLYVNAMFTEYINGLHREESDLLLDYLYKHSIKSEFTCRFRWSKGSIAFWDNRCTLHNPINDYPGKRRVMHRIVVTG